MTEFLFVKNKIIIFVISGNVEVKELMCFTAVVGDLRPACGWEESY